MTFGINFVIDIKYIPEIFVYIISFLVNAMKYILSFLLFICINCEVFSQSEIIQAVRKGDVDSFNFLFDDEVNLSFDDRGDTYSKTKAVFQLEHFFTDNKPTSFKPTHSSESPDYSNCFTIGNLKTSGKTFRVYIKYSHIKGKAIIREMRFNSN